MVDEGSHLFKGYVASIVYLAGVVVRIPMSHIPAKLFASANRHPECRPAKTVDEGSHLFKLYKASSIYLAGVLVRVPMLSILLPDYLLAQIGILSPAYSAYDEESIPLIE